MIDEQGYRPNIGIVVANNSQQVLWARRRSRDGWQFPQGGIDRQETPEQALLRELREEVGLLPDHVEILGRTRDWLHYDIPTAFQRHRLRPSHDNDHSAIAFRGQKQIWFLLRLVGDEGNVRFDQGGHAEFDSWRWIEYWAAVDQIISFKRPVYRQALTELEPLLKLCTQSPQVVDP